MKIYFVRHGESEANLTGTFSNRDLEHHLTETGVQQARELALRLAPTRPSFLWSSPILRARQTADIISEEIGIAPQVTDALREYDVGIYEGTSDPRGWEEYNAVLFAWNAGDFQRRVGGGESLEDMIARLRALIGEVSALAAADECVVAVGHGGLFRCALPYLLSNVSPTWASASRIGACDWIIAENVSEVLRCIDWCGQPPS